MFSNVLGVATVVVTGTMVGVEFAVAFIVNRIFDRLPNNMGIAGRADGGRVLGFLMPFWYIGSMLLGTVWAFVAPAGTSTAEAAAGAALLAVSVAMSLLLLVPINNRGKHWTPETAPDDWREQANAWERYHYIRVGVIMLAFALFAAALT